MTKKNEMGLESSALKYIPGVIATALAVMQDEYIKGSLRSSGTKLPIPKEVQDAYYYNSGDFSDGMWISFGVDAALGGLKHYTSSLSHKNLLKKASQYIENNEKVRMALPMTVASLGVILEETQGLASVADINDIPAGIAGAALYTAIRFKDKLFKRKKEKTIESTFEFQPEN